MSIVNHYKNTPRLKSFLSYNKTVPADWKNYRITESRIRGCLLCDSAMPIIPLFVHESGYAEYDPYVAMLRKDEVCTICSDCFETINFYDQNFSKHRNAQVLAGEALERIETYASTGMLPSDYGIYTYPDGHASGSCIFCDNQISKNMNVGREIFVPYGSSHEIESFVNCCELCNVHIERFKKLYPDPSHTTKLYCQCSNSFTVTNNLHTQWVNFWQGEQVKHEHSCNTCVSDNWGKPIETKINCKKCGKETLYWNTILSKHNKVEYYRVCAGCLNKELKELNYDFMSHLTVGFGSTTTYVVKIYKSQRGKYWYETYSRDAVRAHASNATSNTRPTEISTLSISEGEAKDSVWECVSEVSFLLLSETKERLENLKAKE